MYALTQMGAKFMASHQRADRKLAYEVIVMPRPWLPSERQLVVNLQPPFLIQTSTQLCSCPRAFSFLSFMQSAKHHLNSFDPNVTLY
jgi:hypothetical protein